MRLAMLALAALLALPGPTAGPAAAGERPDFSDRPAVGQPLRFTDGRGHVFRPRTLVVVTPSDTLAAALPAATDNAVSEEHLDLSDSPLIGHVFRRRLAPSDAAREGIPVGPLYRSGDTLVLDARNAAAGLTGRDLVLTANFPRDGAVSYRLGRLDFAPATRPGAAGAQAGTAYLVGEELVLAGSSGGPLITDWGSIFGGGN